MDSPGYIQSAGGHRYFERQAFDSGVYTHRISPFADVNGGAETFVFETPFQNPLIVYRGPGRLAGQFLPFQAIPEISLHPIGAPQGLPIVTRDIWQQESNQINGEGVIVSE